MPSNASPLVASHHATDKKYHLLLAATGSVATIKLPTILNLLASTPLAKQSRLSVRVLLTPSATHFLQGQSDEQPPLFATAALSATPLEAYPHVDGVYLDADEWAVPWKRGAPILHIELRRWADLLVIAPLSAGALAKMANGLSDGLLGSVLRAWEVWPREGDEGYGDVEEEVKRQRQKRVVVAPAMNTMMWRHPLTARQLRDVFGEGWDGKGEGEGWMHWGRVLPPIQKELACGDTGDGAMCSVETIRDAILADVDAWEVWNKMINGDNAAKR